MLIIPAIDIQDGVVVRLTQGAFDKKIYSRNPLKTAQHWARQGAKLIHIVDLDGAFKGVPKNLDVVKEIASAIDTPVQFGGGVRKTETIKELLDSGIARVVLGTKAIEDKSFLKKAFSKFRDKIIVSIDAKGSNVLTGGWKDKFTGGDVVEVASTLKDIGFKEMIYTDVAKDGTLSGPNIKGLKKLLKESGMKIIASGGICSLDDIRRLKLLEKQGITGIIVGKAFYEGKFTLREALKIA